MVGDVKLSGIVNICFDGSVGWIAMQAAVDSGFNSHLGFSFSVLSK